MDDVHGCTSIGNSGREISNAQECESAARMRLTYQQTRHT